MKKQALIAIGVIAVLGIGTYAIIVSKNTPPATNSGTGSIPVTPSTPNSNGNTNTYITIAESALCKLFKIGCPDAATTPTTAHTTTPTTATQDSPTT